VFDERGVSDHIPYFRGIFVVGAPALGAHPAAFIAEGVVKLANDEIVGSAGGISPDIGDERGTERVGALGITGGEPHPPPGLIPRRDVTGRENQIAANKNAGTGPKRSVVVMVITDPNLADGAMRPNMKTLVDLTIEVTLAITRSEFA
jgi:hypothetical protein